MPSKFQKLRRTFLTIFSLLILSFAAQAQTKIDYEKFIETAMNDFGKAAAQLDKDFKLGSYERWDFSQDTGELVFSDKGVAKVVAKVQIAGSYSTYSSTWKWAWSNETIDAALRKDTDKVKDFGEKNKFKQLTTEMFECDEDDARELTAAAGQIIKAKGAFRGRIDNGFVYLLITDINWAKNKK